MPELQSRRHVLLPNNYLTDGHPTIRADREWLEYFECHTGIIRSGHYLHER